MCSSDLFPSHDRYAVDVGVLVGVEVGDGEEDEVEVFLLF